MGAAVGAIVGHLASAMALMSGLVGRLQQVFPSELSFTVMLRPAMPTSTYCGAQMAMGQCGCVGLLGFV